MSRPSHASRRSSLVGALLAALIAGALALAPATGASAHDYLVDSTPKAGSVQTQPLSTVTLTFNDRILDLAGDGSNALLQVTGPGTETRHFETACPTVEDRVLTVPVSLGAAGTYRVTWQIVSADGHTVSDAIAFTYRPPAGTVASEGNAVGPACGRTETGSTAAPESSAGAGGTAGGATAQTSDLGLVLGIAIGIVVLALGGVVVIVLTSRRKPAAEAGPRSGSGPSPTP